MKQFLLLLLLMLSLPSCATETSNAIKDIHPDTVTDIIKTGDVNFQLIDIRTKEEYQNGHLKGSVNIPHHLILDNISALEPYKEKHLIFYCHSGGRVGKVLSIITPENYAGIYHMTGDYRYWKNNNYPIEK